MFIRKLNFLDLCITISSIMKSKEAPLARQFRIAGAKRLPFYVPLSKPGNNDAAIDCYYVIDLSNEVSIYKYFVLTSYIRFIII